MSITVRSLEGYQIVRRLPDGRWEVKNPRGQAVRIAIFVCRACKKINVPAASFNQAVGECIACISKREAESREKSLRRHRIERLSGADTAVKRRQRMSALAKPQWRNHKEIRKVYKAARAKTVETGIPHHVDHYYPIQGDWCCGLHVHQNLRVLPVRENSQKCNSHPMEDSPALRWALEELGEAGLSQAKFEMLRDVRLVQC